MQLSLRGKREGLHKLWNTKRLMGLGFDEDYDNVTKPLFLLKFWVLVSSRVMNFNSKVYFSKDF